MVMHSSLYVGQVRHRRFGPKPHAFAYRLFMLYLDLRELPELFARHWLWSYQRPNLAWFRRADHLGDPQVPLDTAVRDLVERSGAPRPDGPIRLLTHLRYFGYCFNPVSFYFCFDQRDQRVDTIVAEVNNTPWKQQYCYVLHNDGGDRPGTARRYQLDKRFHVSPFMDMAMRYDWRFSHPGERLAVHMENHTQTHKLFDATLSLQRRPIDSANLASALLRYPLMTARLTGAIYYQALRLWLKRTPFFPHPEKKEAPDPVKQR
jgi:DUF1365 family protein